MWMRRARLSRSRLPRHQPLTAPPPPPPLEELDDDEVPEEELDDDELLDEDEELDDDELDEEELELLGTMTTAGSLTMNSPEVFPITTA